MILFRPLLIAIGLLVAQFLTTTGWAADKSNEIDYPLFVLNAASFQKVRDNIALMFDSAERADVTTKLDQWTVDGLKDTKGFDRDRPFGIMFYLNPALLGPPIAISYLPVTNLDEALTTLAHEFGELKPDGEFKDRYQIIYGESLRIVTLYRGGYLFLTSKEKDEDSPLDKNFPDPEKLSARLTSQYDLALSFMLKSLSEALKKTFITFFNAQSKAHLQQRNEEPESAYRLRRANGEFWIELIDRIVNQGQELTLGGRIDNENHIGLIDFEIAGTRDSKLAKFFQGMVGKRTYFGNLLENPATFTFSTSVQFEEKQRKLFVTYFETALKDLGRKPKSTDTDTDTNTDTEKLIKLVEPIFKNLIQTSDVGHLDLIAQLTGTERGEFAFVAGAKLATSRSLPTQIVEVLEYVKDNPNGNELMEKLEVGFVAIDSHPVHRIPINPPDESGQRMFGDSANLYLYASPQAIWCSFGGDAALEGLKNAIQSVSLPQDVQQTRNRVPFQFITHARNWLSLSDDENPQSIETNQRANDSFQGDNDTMKLEIRPTDSGVRARIEFELGYLSFIGRGISSEVDKGIFRDRGKERRGRRNEGRDQDAGKKAPTAPQN